MLSSFGRRCAVRLFILGLRQDVHNEADANHWVYMINDIITEREVVAPPTPWQKLVMQSDNSSLPHKLLLVRGLTRPRPGWQGSHEQQPGITNPIRVTPDRPETV